MLDLFTAYVTVDAKTAPCRVRFANLKHTRDMKEAKIVVGKQFGFWQVVSSAADRILPSGKPVRMVKCRCQCGKEKNVYEAALVKGETKSCGCRRAELFAQKVTRHGHAKKGKPTPEYKAWGNMIDRCENPLCRAYKWYGARGISVCLEWGVSFICFLRDMGPRPSKFHSIDRFPDKDGNYEPGNCRWATDSQQNGNRRTSVVITAGGVSMFAAEWERKTGIASETIIRRIKVRGMTPEDATSIPVAKRYQKKLPTAI